MTLKILPQFYEELDMQYFDKKSKYFQEGRRIDDFPKIHDHINKLTDEEVSIFVKYMEEATIVYAWMGCVEDPLCPQNNLENIDYSDGAFLWREMHIYLVKRYHMDLPIEFKKHVLSNRNNVLLKYSQEELQTKVQMDSLIPVKYS